MNYFCTLFDSNYLSRGLALLESLEATTGAFHLFVVAFDSACFEVLQSIGNKNISVISLNEFEDEALLQVKPTRTKGEYCWTCTPSLVLFCLKNFNLKECTYLDADLYFFSDPQQLLDEVTDQQSVLITEHRYTPEYDQTLISGKYCVQFMTFKNSTDGLFILEWWREKCIEWCFARIEDGKLGDQKYLDGWLEKFPNVHELAHLGGGMAPWNIQQYEISMKDNKLFAREKNKKSTFDVVFYHFHALKFLTADTVDFGGYKLDKNILMYIYRPYCLHLEKIKEKIIAAGRKIDVHGQNLTKKTPFQKIIFFFKRLLKNNMNVFSIKKIRVNKWPI